MSPLLAQSVGSLRRSDTSVVGVEADMPTSLKRRDCPWLCKNSTRYNRTRNFGLYGHAESKKTQKFVFRSALRPNQISFSHDQDLKRTSTSFACDACSRLLIGKVWPMLPLTVSVCWVKCFPGDRRDARNPDLCYSSMLL